MAMERLILVLWTRPTLSDVYSEYAAYYNHQLDHGWKL